MKESKFELSNLKRKQLFSFTQSFAYVSIIKISIDSLLGLDPKTWFPNLQKLNPQLMIKCEGTPGEFKVSTIDILGLISPSNYHPIIEVSIGYIVFPEYHTMNPSGLSTYPFYKNATVELLLKTVEDDLLRMTLYYEKTQGVYQK